VSSRPFSRSAFNEAFGNVRRVVREADRFLADVAGQPSPAVQSRAEAVARQDEKRVRVFLCRDDIWGMLYGSMPVS
jgi:hypothetical protein